MSRDENRLLRHLATAVVVKLALLTALWWAFIRDARVNVDADRAAARISATPFDAVPHAVPPPGEAQ